MTSGGPPARPGEHRKREGAGGAELLTGQVPPSETPPAHDREAQAVLPPPPPQSPQVSGSPPPQEVRRRPLQKASAFISGEILSQLLPPEIRAAAPRTRSPPRAGAAPVLLFTRPGPTAPRPDGRPRCRWRSARAPAPAPPGHPQGPAHAPCHVRHARGWRASTLVAGRPRQPRSSTPPPPPPTRGRPGAARSRPCRAPRADRLG